MVRSYVLLAWVWTRAAVAYPASFALMTVFGFLVAGLDLVAILIIFANTTSLAGFSREEVLFLYGTASLAFSVADTLFSNVDRISQKIKDGSFDVILLRPVSAWVQACTDRFFPARIGRILQAGGVLGYAVAHAGIVPERSWLVPVMVVGGIAIFGALWTLAGSVQFVLTDAPEVVNAFTYGSGTLVQYPLTVYGRDLVRAVTYVLPLAFVNWLPGLYVLGRADPAGLPSWTAFLSPVVAAALCLVAGLAWRQGIRHYRSTGS
ncbi:ABC-2 family transporter protein [Nonomuraea sp. NPDC050310]|uniref:ABC transporter permease n=1 Tax=unclassified Nonomuraea TaxID=2593643 RepID=UPI0033DA1777